MIQHTRYPYIRRLRDTAALLILGCVTATAGPLPKRLPDMNLCEGSVTHKDRVAVKPVARPPLLKYYRDPGFGSKVIRISDAARNEVYKPAYSTMQAWNADESRLLLYYSGEQSHHVLLDGFSYKKIQDLDIYPSDLEEIFWSHTDPDIFFYVSKDSKDYGQFKQYNVASNTSTKITDFQKLCGKRGMPTSGGDVHMQSLDDDLFGFRCDTDDDSWLAFTYRISDGEIHTLTLDEDKGWEAWTAPTPAPDGKQIWLQGQVMDVELSTQQRQLDVAKSSEHSNIGQTHDGKNALFQTAFDPSPDTCGGDLWQGVGHLVIHELDTGSCRPMINQSNGYPYTTSGTHVSAQAYKRPGWIAMSSIGYGQFEFFTNKRKAPVLYSEIYLANTDPDNEVVCRLAQHRSFAKDANNGDYAAYFGEPHATISPSGTRIIFGSDWYDSGAVDSYVIELPAYKKP